jgi:hypothetical protein
MFKCEYCNKTFKREGTLAVHVCEPKRRFQQKDSKHVQLAFRSYQLFYRIGTNSKKEKSYEDFSGSQYYTAFVKFGSYCIDLKIDDVPVYTTWLLKNNIAIDRWCSDRNFNTWIKERLKSESCDRAVERTILFMQDWGEDNANEWNNYFDAVPSNLAVFHICSGKISPWVLYASNRAQALLDRLNEEQIKMIIEYIDPHVWQIKMKRFEKDFNWVKQLLKKAHLS